MPTLVVQSFREDIKQDVIDLYFNQNKTSYELGDEYGVSPNTIMTVINNYKYANTEVI